MNKCSEINRENAYLFVLNKKKLLITHAFTCPMGGSYLLEETNASKRSPNSFTRVETQ